MAAVLTQGDIAPDFTALDEYEREISLSDFSGLKTVVFFYIEDNGNADVTMARGYRELFPAMKELGAIVIGIGPGNCDSHAKFKEERLLPFILVVDEDNKIAKKYGTYGTRCTMGKQVESPLRGHLVIAEDGMILAKADKVGASDSAKLALRSLSRYSK